MPRFNRHRDDLASCPACTAVGLEHFYQVDGVPTSSNLLMSTREEAVGWPRGDLRRAFCPACGLITNTAFDPSTQQLTARYEATQACSATFGKFARHLAQDWIDRYSLRGKKLLEIGCGQGEFIAMLCEMADARGWGLDPIVDPGRTPAGGRVEFIPEKYGAKWSRLEPDFVVCRHTLEHIPDVAAFLKCILDGLGRERNGVLAIEVPDNHRVLCEAAFWDIYYEHCSYFDTPSLKNALRCAGFAPLRDKLEFAGQYLVVESEPGERIVAKPPEPAVIDRFALDCEVKLAMWEKQLAEWRPGTIIWGSGSKAVGFLTTLGAGGSVEAVVDINPAKQGTFLPGSGHEIISPAALKALRPRRVIVMNPIYLEEIRGSLSAMGLTPELFAL